jgi:hypothetical protein
MMTRKALFVALAAVTLAVPAGAEVNQNGEAVVTAAGLPGFLRLAGYEPTKVSDRHYEIVERAVGKKLRFHVVISESGRKVWLEVACKEFQNTDGVPRANMVRMLEENYERGPFHFVIGKSLYPDTPNLKSIIALVPVENRNMTTDMFKSYLKFLIRNLEETKAIWDY